MHRPLRDQPRVRRLRADRRALRRPAAIEDRAGVRRALAPGSELDGVVGLELSRGAGDLAYRNRAKLAVARVDGATQNRALSTRHESIVDLAECAVTSRCSVARSTRFAAGSTRIDSRVRTARCSTSISARAVGGRWHLTLGRRRRALRSGDAAARRAESPFVPRSTASPSTSVIRSSSYPMGAITRVVRGSDTFDAARPRRARAARSPSGTGGRLLSRSRPRCFPTIHRRMRVHLGSDGPLYDLYCGVGVHGLMIERAVERPRIRASSGSRSPGRRSAAARANATRLGDRRALSLPAASRPLLAGELESRSSTALRAQPGARGLSRRGPRFAPRRRRRAHRVSVVQLRKRSRAISRSSSPAAACASPRCSRSISCPKPIMSRRSR